MNLFKRTTASIALVTLVSSLLVSGVSAYSPAELEAANALAAKNVINAQSDAAGYNLDANVLRQEIFKVGAGVAGISPETTCNNTFGDISATTPNGWVCGYAEALLANEMLTKNANARPSDNISKAEAVKLMLETAGHTAIFTDAAKWQEQVVAYAASKGVVSSFSDYGTAATRGFVFGAANNAMAEEEVTDEIDLEALLGLGDDEDEEGTDSTDEGTDSMDETTTVSGNGDLEVSLAASTPAGATIPGAISGLPVASFDFTAGSEDVTVSSLVVKRTGLSAATTLTALAAFTSEGRASKAKNDSQENNTQATLTLSNGGVIVKAGETRTLSIVADIASQTVANGAEFAIELLEVTANATSTLDGELVGNTMKVGGVDAATVTVKTDGTVSDVKVGDDAVEIFKFKVEGADDEDVVLTSITFKGEGSVDEEDEISNYQLDFEGTVVATTASANGKYVTFNLGEGVTIKEGQTERFKVLADVVSGVNEVIAFKVDKTLDVTAMGTKYGFGASVNIDDVDAASGTSGGTNDLGDLTIDAGELTLSDIDAPADKIRADKDDVVLGSIKVSNVSGAALELQSFAVNAVLGGSAFIDDGSGTGTVNDGSQNGSEASATLATVFQNFEVEINGTSYELTEVGGVYGDTDLTVSLPEGVTTMVIKADTKKHVSATTTVALTVTNIGTTGFKAVELQEDTAVSDITPSSLSFKDVEFISAGAVLSSVPLANVNVVRGSENIVANQFELKAEEASYVEVDEVKVTVAGYTTGGTTVAAADAQKVISSITLYKGSVSDSNLLDEQSGTKISAAGLVTFDGFKTKIAANDTETLLVVLDVVDGVDSVSKVLTVDVTSVSATDDDGDDVIITGTALNNKTVTVNNSGSFTVTLDTNNDANEEDKTILAGTSRSIASYDVQAQNEAVDVETVEVTFDNATNLSDSFLSARLLLDGEVVGTATNSDLSATVVTFDDLTSLIIPTDNVELEVEVTTSTIGFEKVGSAIAANFITNINLKDAIGDDSGKTVSAVADTTDGKNFAVVDVVVTASIVALLNNGTAQVKLTADAGDNTTSGNAAPTVTLTGIDFTDNGTAAGEYKVYENGESAPAAFADIGDYAVGSANATALAGITSISFTDSVIINVLAEGTVDLTYALDLDKTGIKSNAGFKMDAPLPLGTKTY